MALDVYAYRCKKCGTLHYPFRMRCRKCGELTPFEFETEPLPKKGKLLTFTKVYNLSGDFDVATLDLGIVELENGLRMMGQLQIDKPKIGMPVSGEVGVVRKDAYHKYHGMIFRKA